MLNSIDNSQTSVSFKGNLLKEGLKLPQKKFNEVAKLYAEQTKGLPDLKLIGKRYNNMMDGFFYHATQAFMGNNVATIDTGSFKNMFKDYSPKRIAEELINITKEFVKNQQFNKYTEEIDGLYTKLYSTERKLKQATDSVDKNRLQALCEKIERTIEHKEEMIGDIKRSRCEVSKEWSIDEV